MEAYPSEGLVLLNPASIDVESSSAALCIRSFKFLVLEVCIGVRADYSRAEEDNLKPIFMGSQHTCCRKSWLLTVFRRFQADS